MGFNLGDVSHELPLQLPKEVATDAETLAWKTRLVLKYIEVEAGDSVGLCLDADWSWESATSLVTSLAQTWWLQLT